MSMTTPYRVVATGAIVWPGAIVAGCQTHENMSADAWAGLGCEPYIAPPPDPPTPPTLAEAKAAAIEANRTACTANILAPLDSDQTRARDKQASVIMGLYGQALQDQWPVWVNACIAAENAAADAIEAAVDVAAVAAVTVNWPTWSN